MIFNNVTGRCGNQLFQYAYMRKLSLLNNDFDFTIDFFHVKRIGKEKNDISFCDELKNFNVLPYRSITECANCVEKYGTKKQKRIYKNRLFVQRLSTRFRKKGIYLKYLNRMAKYGIYREDFCSLMPRKTKVSNIFIRGYFENPAFFDDIKDILLKEFTPNKKRLKENNELYEIIERNESVCVSIRVWNDIQKESNLYMQRNVCTKEYYQRSIEKMAEILPDAVFIVFSNDIEWVKNNVTFNRPVYFERGIDPIYEKLRLMYSCKHFIISTSTFSWWAQYLSRNNSKVVIAPNKWYNDETTSFLLSENWIKISVDAS